MLRTNAPALSRLPHDHWKLFRNHANKQQNKKEPEVMFWKFLIISKI